MFPLLKKGGLTLDVDFLRLIFFAAKLPGLSSKPSTKYQAYET
jgi:hypothetical protein